MEGQSLQNTVEYSHQTFQVWIDHLVDPNISEDQKLKSVQDLSLNLELMQTLPTYSQLIEDAMQKIVRLLTETEPQFLLESSVHQLRKKTLEILQRTHPFLSLTQFDKRLVLIRQVLSVIDQLLEKENEENVILCLKIIIEFYKNLKNGVPVSEVQQYFKFVKGMYQDLAQNVNLVFQYKPLIKVNDLNELNVTQILNESFSSFQIQTEKANQKENQSYHLIPRGTKSLKVLAELPLNTVTMYQNHKQYLSQDISDLLVLISNVIVLKPTEEQRNNPELKEVIADFVTAQVRALSFIAYFKNHQDYLKNNADLFVKGILDLFKTCPAELVSVRKDLLAISRHIISENKMKFLPHLSELFDENLFCSNGYAASESLRSSACSVLTDLVHHIRKELSSQDLCKAIQYFLKGIHDPLLNSNLQQMCYRVLISLTETIRTKENARDLIQKMLQVFVLKLKSIAKFQLPALLEQICVPTSPTSNSTTSDKKSSDLKSICQFAQNQSQDDKTKPKVGQMSELDIRSTLRIIVMTSRSLTLVLLETKSPIQIDNLLQKNLQPTEIKIYSKLLKYALRTLQIYTQNKSNTQKEEKEIIETLGLIFTHLNHSNQKLIFEQNMDLLINLTFKYSNLSILASYFLATLATSCTFSTILIENLLDKLDLMGDSNTEQSNLYLKLFKLVFGSVSVFPTENEKMLKPHLHSIVTKSLDHALKSKEPHNYFLLLRALFRSIGGGNHDLLYQEFLPLLPILLQSLNELQTGVHKQHLKDLFVELCLTVPVRLSSLLPYLPMLMDPLVSALNGSTTLVSQGLRTLELCVDNLQPDFLYEHIQPVRQDLIHGLWKQLRSSNETIALAAYRVLGKLGGSNRKMIVQAQQLTYEKNESPGYRIQIEFTGYNNQLIDLDVESTIDACLHCLKLNSNNSSIQDLTFYKLEAFNFVSSFLLSLVKVTDQDQHDSFDLFCNYNPIFSSQLSQYFIKTQKFKSEKIRDQVIRSFECLYYSSSIKDNQEYIISLIDSLCVHITLTSLSHYNNQNEQNVNTLIRSMNVLTNSLETNEDISLENSAYLDYMILIDALFVVLCNDDSEYWSLVQRTILIIIETSEIVSSTKSSLAQSQMAIDDTCIESNLANLAMFDYLSEKLSQLCYERSWYAKKAGCIVLKLLTNKMPLQWTLQQCFVFIKSIFNVLVSVTGEISSGAINVAKDVLNNLAEVCFAKLDLTSANDTTNTIVQLTELQQKTLNDVLKELVKQITSSSQYVRHESINLIKKIGELQSKSIYNLLQPFQEILLETVGPRKHLKLRHYSHQFQIGILESLEFCSSTQPQLFTLQLSNQDHQNLYNEIISICDQEDSNLSKLACYKSLTDLTPIRRAALNCLASFYHLLDQREQILNILHKSLDNPLKQIQQVSFNCLKNYNKNSEHHASQMSQNQTLPSGDNHRQIIQIAADYLREYLHPLTEYIYMKKDVVQHLSYITKLYPTILNDKFTEYLLSHLKRWLEDTFQIFKENLENQSQTITKPCHNEIELCSSIISLLAELQSAPAKLVESSIALVLKYEKIFGLEASEKFRRPLSDFLKRFPFETLKYLLHNDRIKDMYCFRFILYLSKKQTVHFCQIFKSEPNRLVQMLNESQTFLSNGLNQQNIDLINKSNQILYLTVFVIYRLIKIEANKCWLQSQGQLIEVLLKVWCDEKFHEKHSQIDNLNHIYWKEPIYVLKALLKYHEIQLDLHARNEATYALNSNIELLFKLLIAFHQKSISQFEFFRVYLSERVAKEYSIQLKRDIFFTFVQIFTTQSNSNSIYTQKLKSSILQHIVIPCFTCAFEKGEHEAIIGGPPNPDTDSPDNIISVFINNVVDPDQNQTYSDAVRIHLLQLSCLFVQYAHDYIHNVNNKKQGTKLRRLMTFAWPSLLAKTCVDPFNKYQGLLLLSHIISKFAIHKRIVFQVFHSLLKAYAPEAKLVVRQALQILTPTFPTRSEDGYITLASWTKKILIEENHSVPQLSHLIFIIVRYFKVFYYIRHTLINQLIVALQKVGLSQNSTNENKLLIIDLCETILKWEAQRTLDSEDANFDPNLKLKHADLLKPFDKHICDFVMNFLIRFACQMAPPQTQEASQHSNTNLNEQLCRKCLNLFQMAIKNDLLSNFDLKLEILDKILTSLESTFGQNPLVTNILGANASVPTTQIINLNQVYICLEILSFLIENTSKQKIQLILKSLHRGFQYSIVSTNSKVIKLIADIIQKLMLTIPNELFNTMSNNESVETSAAEPIYSLFGQPDGVLCRMILESLSYYEKMSLINPSETSSVNLAIDILTNCLTLIKAASVNNHQYIDRLMGPILKIIQKLYRDHLNSIGSVGQLVSSQEGANVVQAQNSVQVYLFSELIIQVIDLVKNRVGVMSSEMRKMFVNQILVNLIDKSIDLRLIKYLVKLINDWIKMNQVANHVTNVLPNQIPTMKEKLVLLQKLTICMDKKYSDQAEIQSVFLDTISYVYQNDAYLAQQEFKCKLEQAFLLGIKSPNVKMRQLFYDLFNRNFQSNDLYERLCFVLVTQNWELFGTYYWIKQCIQLTLGSCYNLNYVNNTFEPKFLSLVEAQNVPLGSNTLNSSSNTLTSSIQIDDQDSSEPKYQLIAPLDFEVDFSKKEKFLNVYKNEENESMQIDQESFRFGLIKNLFQFEKNLIKMAKKTNLSNLIDPICNMCHINTDLAHSIWTQLFAKFFNLFNEKQKINLINELTPFFASGIHSIQKNTQLSVLNTFCESMIEFGGELNACFAHILKPSLLSYLAKNHNLWHRSILLCENQYLLEPNIDVLQVLIHLLSTLKEEDLKTGLLVSNRTINDPTRIALIYEQQGMFLQAQKLFEDMISKNVDSYLNDYLNKEEQILESNLWEEKWVKCCKELNQWSELNDYISTKDNDLSLTLDCAWKSQPDWQLMKTRLMTQKENNISKDQLWKWYLYQGYYLVCNPDDLHHLMLQSQSVFSLSAAIESKVEKCMISALKEWRRLPKLITPAHTSLLQAAQQIIELQEAFQIQQNLTTPINQTQALQETKGIIKTWRTRLPLINDDLSYWNDIFQWRQFHYESFTKYFEKQQPNSNQAMLGVHALAQGIVTFGKIARKQHLYDICLETLNKIHRKQSVPIIDCFLKVKQEIKCYINTYEYLSSKQSKEILDLIEATNLQYFTKENVAELISLKAQFLQLNNKFDEANHLYSFSIYLNDSSAKLWGAWADYLTQAFVDVTSRQLYSSRSIEAAESALIGLMNAARHTGGEAKTRKYIAKIFWLLSYDNEKRDLFNQFEAHALSAIPAQNWIQWIPQLITLILKNDDNGKYLYSLINQIIRQYPLAVYYPLRTLYFKIKQDEHADKIKQQIFSQQKQQAETQADFKETKTNSSVESLVRGVVGLMHVQREMHPLLFNTIEGLIDQLLMLKCTWHQDLLKNFKHTLNYVYTFAYETNLNKQNDFIETIDPFSIIWFKRIHKFYVDFQYLQLPNRLNTQQNSPLTGSVSSPLTPTSNVGQQASCSGAQNQQNTRLKSLIAILNDPNHQITRQKFQQDFPYTQTSGSQQQQISIKEFIDKLKSWIRMLEAHNDLMIPKKSLLDERFKLVSQFCSSTAEIELPGEYLVPRSTNYYVKISRFLPVYESVEKHQIFCRRISIRGHNGKIYPFLIMNEPNHFYESKKEEHCLQVFRMINTYLNKQKETSGRSLNFIIPRMVSLSYDFRMIEDEVSSLSLLDILKPHLKQKCLDTYFAQRTFNTKLDLYKLITESILTKNILKQWAIEKYKNASDYFNFRKLFAQQISIYNVSEFILGLSSLKPSQIYLSQNSGLCQTIRYKFDLDDKLSQSSKIVPFRLTPNMTEFFQQSSINGQMGAAMTSLARCLHETQYGFIWILRTILKDEILYALIRKKQEDSIKNSIQSLYTNLSYETEQENVVNLVNKLVGTIELRLKECANMDNGKNFPLNELIPKAMKIENLSEIDPTWYPWF